MTVVNSLQAAAPRREHFAFVGIAKSCRGRRLNVADEMICDYRRGEYSTGGEPPSPPAFGSAARKPKER
jgi:hypothetical protein